MFFIRALHGSTLLTAQTAPSLVTAVTGGTRPGPPRRLRSGTAAAYRRGLAANGPLSGAPARGFFSFIAVPAILYHCLRGLSRVIVFPSMVQRAPRGSVVMGEQWAERTLYNTGFRHPAVKSRSSAGGP